MRRSGSSSCLLRPKSDASPDGDKMSVTLINRELLPKYSSERFYMLSELELHCHSTLFLCDLLDCDQTQDTVDSSEASMDAQAPQHASQPHAPISPFTILYILWRPDQTSSPRAFAEGTVAAAIQQWKSLVAAEGGTVSVGSNTPKENTSPTRNATLPTTTSPRLYLVVDIAARCSSEHNNPTNTCPTTYTEMTERQFQIQVDAAERLARHVAQLNDFRSAVDGITVGIANHVRAAPGLEACVNAVTVGARDRRKQSFSHKSLVGIAALHPDELLGLQDSTVTDAAQGVLQSRTCAEWNGNGNLQSFARRAHSAWCIIHNVDEEEPIQKRRSKRKRRELDGDFSLDFLLDPFLTCLVVFLIGYVLSQLWIMMSARQQQ